MENFPDGERSEMVELYEAQGLSKTDATMVIDTMSKPEYAKFFVDLMMMAEIGLLDPDHEPSELRVAVLSMMSFLMFGFWPLFIIASLRWLGWFDVESSAGQVVCVACSAAMIIVVFKAARIGNPNQRLEPLLLVLGLAAFMSVKAAQSLHQAALWTVTPQHIQ